MPRRKGKVQQVVSEAELQRKHQRWISGFALLRSLGLTAIIGVFAWLCVHSIFYLPVQAAHGEMTTINVVQTLAANVNASIYLAWGVAAAGAAYGAVERRKRNRERAEKDERIAELERKIDPNRTSSDLTPGGEVSRESQK